MPVLRPVVLSTLVACSTPPGGEVHAVAETLGAVALAVPFDMDGDGVADLVTCEPGSGLWWRPSMGDGSWGPPGLAFASDACGPMVPADIDGDGVDALVWFTARPDVWIVHGMGHRDPIELVPPPFDAIAADLDGDGTDELVSSGVDGITWCIDLASTPRCASTPGLGYARLAAADTDGDGDRDVLAGNGLGLFTCPNSGVALGPCTVIGLPEVVQDVATGDLDGDGDPDAVIGTPEGVRTLENLGGVWADPQTIDPAPLAVVQAGDVDGDGDLDIAGTTGDPLDNRAIWLESDGGWTPHALHDDVVRGTDLHIADLTGDGRPDIATAFGVPVTFRGIEGGFEPGVRPWLGHVDAAVLADLDGDGRPDLVTSSVDTRRAHRFSNTAGALGHPALILTDPDGIPADTVAAGDLDGDGDGELVGEALLDGLAVWWQGVDGFGPAEVLDPSFGRGLAQVVDLDGDGDLDVCRGADTWANEDGRLAATEAPDWWLDADSLGDLDGDGLPDLVAVRHLDREDCDPYCYGPEERAVVVLPNVGGRFGPPVDLTPRTDSDVYGVVADLDGDGDGDLIHHDHAGALQVRENVTGVLAGSRDLPGTTGAGTLIPADLDADGHLDLLQRDGGLSWHRGRGDRTFDAAIPIPLHPDPTDPLDVADIDGDGDLDVLVAGTWIRWWENPAH